MSACLHGRPGCGVGCCCWLDRTSCPADVPPIESRAWRRVKAGQAAWAEATAGMQSVLAPMGARHLAAARAAAQARKLWHLLRGRLNAEVRRPAPLLLRMHVRTHARSLAWLPPSPAAAPRPPPRRCCRRCGQPRCRWFVCWWGWRQPGSRVGGGQEGRMHPFVSCFGRLGRPAWARWHARARTHACRPPRTSPRRPPSTHPPPSPHSCFLAASPPSLAVDEEVLDQERPSIERRLAELARAAHAAAVQPFNLSSPQEVRALPRQGGAGVGRGRRLVVGARRCCALSPASQTTQHDVASPPHPPRPSTTIRCPTCCSPTCACRPRPARASSKAGGGPPGGRCCWNWRGLTLWRTLCTSTGS